MTSRARRILFIVSHWPPVGGTPSIRPAKIAKFLSRLGFEIEVIAPERTTEEPLNDDSMVSDVGSIAATRVPVRGLRRCFGNNRFVRATEIPDSYRGMVAPSIAAAGNLRPADAVFVSLPPYSLLKAGSFIAKRWRVPLYADIRDLGADNPFYVNKNRLKRFFEDRWERRFLPDCDVILAATAGIRTYFVERRPFAVSPITIPTGFDAEDFSAIEPQRRSDDRILVAHVGALHGYRDVAPVIDAIRKLPGNYIFRFVGMRSGAASSQLKAAQAEFGNRIEILDHVPYREAIRHARSADILLLVETREEPVGGILQLKFFVYLGAGAPIIALSPRNEMTRILDETGRGTAVWPPDSTFLARAIARIRPSAAATGTNASAYEMQETLRPLAELFGHSASGVDVPPA